MYVPVRYVGDGLMSVSVIPVSLMQVWMCACKVHMSTDAH